MADVRLYSAAGNRFAVLDAFEHMPADPAQLARLTCDRFGLDGLLLGARPSAGGDCRMLVFNKDGSRAEACGNGLRALARWAVESEHAHDSLVIETDAGARRVHCLRRGNEIVAARAELGVPRVIEREAVLAHDGQELRATLVDMGNPHCILFVPDVGRAPVSALGAALECHARFPGRTNVSFVELAGRRLLVRTWERGVGETAACGTGAGASAVAALVHGRAHSPVEVGMRGGRLQVDWDGSGVLFLAGPVEALTQA
ncbi:MAG: diaminopimelate epimerase [Planctomycetes bacterium]|nr:diaminopimelate epimerase [Planctomycetota bacterium]